MTNTSHVDDLKARLREQGLRATRPRLAVLAELERRGSPASHAEVVEALSDAGWDRATLYRNLNDLASVGLLRRIDVDHTWRFELVDTSHRTDAHPHFVCVECGDVQCLGHVQIQVDGPAASLLSRQHEVQIRGVCEACVP